MNAPSTPSAFSALPTGDRPTTVAGVAAEPVEQLTRNAAANLYDQLNAIFAQLKATEAAAIRSLDGLRDSRRAVAPEDLAADLLGDRLLHDAQTYLPDTSPYADIRRAEAFAAALFGDGAMRDFARRELSRRGRRGNGDGGAFTIAQEDEFLDDAGYFAALVFRLAKLFFLTGEASAARMFFYAVGVVIAGDTGDAGDGGNPIAEEDEPTE